MNFRNNPPSLMSSTWSPTETRVSTAILTPPTTTMVRPFSFDNITFELITMKPFPASLLDDMDPLSANYGNGGINSSMHPSTGATAKKSIKDAHSFLGENSALVNLDNLIKPIAPQTQTGNQPAYNPFSDNVVPPKTNLFQQQQPAVS